MTTHKTALAAAVTAYDAERCARNNDKPMSNANKATIAPMIEAAITAYLNALGADPVAWTHSDNIERLAIPGTNAVSGNLWTAASPYAGHGAYVPLYAAPAKPGYVLVPEDLTEAMVSAALPHLDGMYGHDDQRPRGQFWPGCTADESEHMNWKYYGADRAKAAYAAMIAAAKEA